MRDVNGETLRVGDYVDLIFLGDERRMWTGIITKGIDDKGKLTYTSSGKSSRMTAGYKAYPNTVRKLGVEELI